MLGILLPDRACIVIAASSHSAMLSQALVLEMSVGEVYKLPALGKGDKGAETIHWSSSDESVVAVKGISLLAAKASGSATLTATASNGKQASVEVRVSDD